MGFAGGSITFKADCPKEVFDKILGNTPEDMARMLQPGSTFDLSDGESRTVAYISFPKGTDPKDVAIVVRCRKCAHWHKDVFNPCVGHCELIGIMQPKDENRENTNEDFFCYYGKERKHYDQDR